MILPWLILSVISLLFLIYKLSNDNKNSNGKKRASKDYWLIISNLYNFCFKVKSEDRLNAFKQIHKFFPRYTRIKFFNLFDYIFVYDPEICKKIFNSNAACQRPFRNCIQLECGLLASKCEFLKTSLRSGRCKFIWLNERAKYDLDLVIDSFFSKLHVKCVLKVMSNKKKFENLRGGVERVRRWTIIS